MVTVKIVISIILIAVYAKLRHYYKSFSVFEKMCYWAGLYFACATVADVILYLTK